jgi:hypothetical protein
MNLDREVEIKIPKGIVKKSLKFLFKNFIAPWYIIFNGIFDSDWNSLCNSTYHIKHDWAYWNSNYTCKDPNIDDFKRYNDHRQCTQCKSKQVWAHWGGLGGDGSWELTGVDLPLDKDIVTIEVYTSAYPSTDGDSTNSDKKDKMIKLKRQNRIDKLLKKKNEK